MFEPQDVRSLSDFQRNVKAHARRLKKSGRPELLTVNGRGTLVVQDAAAYRQMVEELERRHLVEAVRVGLEQMEAGKGIPLEEVTRRIRAKYGTSRKARKSA